MRIGYVTHSAFFEHDTGPNHPERAERLGAVERGLVASAADLVRLEPPAVELDLLERVHSSAHIGEIERFLSGGGGRLDQDTYASKASWEAALRAAGSGPAAIEVLEAGSVDAVFCAVRPPGHHAETDRSMGFCLFNSAAVAARLLADRGDRVAVVDWDVHHGNGTQRILESESRVLYVSLHEFPLYPGTGWVDEVGTGPGRGTVVNVPFPTGTAGDAYRDAFDDLITPVLEGFSADWLIISAGYDAHRSDPLATLRLRASDYAYMASALSKTVGKGRVIFFLEGGYDLDAISESVRATVAGLQDEDTKPESNGPQSPERAWLVLSLAKDTARPFHKLP